MDHQVKKPGRIEFAGVIDRSTPARFRDAVTKAAGLPLHVFIDSIGGGAREAEDIFQMLRAHDSNVLTVVDGQADSAAVLIFLAGHTRVIEQQSTLLIHEPTTRADQVAIVGAEKAARDIAAVRQFLVDRFSVVTGLPQLQISDMMCAATRINAAEAVRLRFAHAIASRENKFPNSVSIGVSSNFGLRR